MKGLGTILLIIAVGLEVFHKELNVAFIVVVITFFLSLHCLTKEGDE